MHFLSQYSINVIKNKGLKNDVRFGIFLLKEQFVNNGAILQINDILTNMIRRDFSNSSYSEGILQPDGKEFQRLFVGEHCLGAQLFCATIIHVQRNSAIQFHRKPTSFRLHFTQTGFAASAEGNKQKNAGF